MSHRISPVAALRGLRRVTRARRHGVSSVLAMMFLVIFGSLAAAMAVVAQGNLRTANSAMMVSRAMSAAETGLVFASRRLESESSRFVIDKGVIDASYGHDLWLGSYDTAADGNVEVLEPQGYTESGDPSGVGESILNAHLADQNTLTGVFSGDNMLPAMDGYGTVRTRAMALTLDANGDPEPDGPYFILKYELLEGLPLIQVTSMGVDPVNDATGRRRDITRTLTMWFEIDKKIEYAVIAPSRIMIGKNVRVEGPLGSVYGLIPGELDTENGDPLVMRSDFYFLDDALDDNLDIFFTQMKDHDVDGDGRLRVYHGDESVGISNAPGVLIDYDLNEYVDDFDLFMAHYDINGDRWVVYDQLLANEAGFGLPVVEFDADLQMARLIDEANPDRDGDGIINSAPGSSDRMLGYRDGILDIKDTYAKVRGTVRFAIARDEWELPHGDSYQSVVQGPIMAGIDVNPVEFEADEETLRELSTDMFNASATWFEAQVPADPPEAPADFLAQVAAGESAGGTYTAPSDATWESIPFDAPGAYDFYQRPIYEDMTFTDVRIPMGNNGLFRNCTFIGVTYIETETDTTDENWNYAGALQKVHDPPDSNPPTYVYEEKFLGLTTILGSDTVTDSKPYSNNIRFDGCTFIGSISGDKPEEYTHWRNKIQLTGETRFYIDPEDPDLLDQPDVDDIVDAIEAMEPDDVVELRKSSILLPGWSADIGNFNNEIAVDPDDTPKVKLKGTIVAGILDIRGTADVFGTVLMTFRPTSDEGPLFYGGLTDAFNTTIGYFGPADGDGEGSDDVTAFGFGEITLRYDPNAELPDGIPWPISIGAQAETYQEGGDL